MKDFFTVLATPAYSLLSRMRKGEGGLWAVTLLLTIRFEQRDLHLITAWVIAGCALALMYAFNDICDAPADAADPARNNTWTKSILEWRRTAHAVNLVQTAFLGTAAFCFLPARFIFFSATFTTSFAYSLRGKRIPLADYALVFAWGPTFVLAFSSGVPVPLALNAGFMLVMSHSFQMNRDIEVDRKNLISTSAVYSTQLQRAMYFSAALGSALCFGLLGYYLSAALSAVTLFTGMLSGFSRGGWYTTKFIHALSWLMLFLPDFQSHF